MSGAGSRDEIPAGALFYVWPCGMFEDADYRGPWWVYRRRAMPSTPQGDEVVKCPFRWAAYIIARELNREQFSLEQARAAVYAAGLSLLPSSDKPRS